MFNFGKKEDPYEFEKEKLEEFKKQTRDNLEKLKMKKQFTDLMLDMMIATGQKGAEITKRTENLRMLLLELQCYCAFEEMSMSEGDKEQIISFLADVEKQATEFFNNIKK